MSQEKVIAADVHDPLIILVPHQQVLAKSKERLIRQTIIFQYDCLVHGSENPV
jgi:hypothetical protein